MCKLYIILQGLFVAKSCTSMLTSYIYIYIADFFNLLSINCRNSILIDFRSEHILLYVCDKKVSSSMSTQISPQPGAEIPWKLSWKYSILKMLWQLPKQWSVKQQLLHCCIKDFKVIKQVNNTFMPVISNIITINVRKTFLSGLINHIQCTLKTLVKTWVSLCLIPGAF